MSKTYEYRIEKVSPSNQAELIERMNDLGAEGWRVLFVLSRNVWMMREVGGESD